MSYACPPVEMFGHENVTGNMVAAPGVREKTIDAQSPCKQQHNLIQAEEKHLSTVMAAIFYWKFKFSFSMGADNSSKDFLKSCNKRA